MRIAILGAGAIGGFLGAHLARGGEDVVLVARGANLKALRSSGVQVREPDGSEWSARPEATDDWSVCQTCEFVFVTLKAHSLPEIAPRLASAAGPSTAMVFAQNGVPWWYFLSEGRRLETVDPGGVVAAHIEPKRAIACVAYPAASLSAPGVVSHVEGNRFSLAELDGSRSERLVALSSALARAGLRAPIQSRIRQEIWLKLLGNATFNPVSALTRATLAEMISDAGVRSLIRTLMLEVEAVGRAVGIENDISVDRRLEGGGRVGEHKTSMLQDVEAGRPLELDALVGAVVELAGQLGVPAPALSIVYALGKRLDAGLRRPG